VGRHTARRDRGRLAHAALAVAVGLQLLGGTYVAFDRHGDTRPVPRPAPDTLGSVHRDPAAEARAEEYRRERKARADAVTALLARRARAVLARDRQAFLADLDPAATGFRRRQAALFDALRDVPIGSWQYDLDPDREMDPRSPDVAYYGAEVYLPEVRLRYALRDFDPEPTRLTQHLTFVERGDRWYLGNDDDFGDSPSLRTARELWDFGPVDVVRTPRALVLGRAGRRALLAQIAKQADAAVPRVTAVWGGDWDRKVVVLVPESQAELGTIISEGNDLSQIAAVAVAQLGGETGDYHPVGNRVIVNPPNFNRLSALGRRVVLQHEITHVATRSATGPGVPTWLVEGFADYLGYLGTGVSVRVAARELRAEVRAGTTPARLPRDEDFDGTNPRLAQMYEMSWLAARLVADRVGEARLVRFYRELGAAEPSDEAVRRVWKSVLGTTPESFTQAWQAYLRQQLG
jgi:hypothetical protein